LTDGHDRSASLLETSGLSKRFGGLSALSDVSLSLRRGELHAVIGPNGAGKSTFVNLLAGELRPTTGTIRLLGREVQGEPAWRRTHLGIGRSFQRTNIFKPLSVIENVRLAAQAVKSARGRLLRPARSEVRLVEMARAAIVRAGLDGSEEAVAGALSHGAQRQLEIAMTLAAHPKVLLLDEPMAGMGPEESERIAALLKTLSEDHAILLIEHDMDFVFAVADRLTVLVEGRVIASGGPAEIRGNKDVQRAYLGDHGG
jgi:branched-chain amino acid transport system ATP-binding protein